MLEPLVLQLSSVSCLLHSNLLFLAPVLDLVGIVSSYLKGTLTTVWQLQLPHLLGATVHHGSVWFSIVQAETHGLRLPNWDSASHLN